MIDSSTSPKYTKFNTLKSVKIDQKCPSGFVHASRSHLTWFSLADISFLEWNPSDSPCLSFEHSILGNESSLPMKNKLNPIYFLPLTHSRIFNFRNPDWLKLFGAKKIKTTLWNQVTLWCRKRTWPQAYGMSRCLNLHCQICVQLSCYLQHLAAIWTDKVLSLFFKRKKKSNR